MSKRKPRGKTRDNKRKRDQNLRKMRKISAISAWRKKILKHDNPILSEECEKVSPGDDLSFIEDMKKVLKASPTGVGLAANQIGVTKNVIVIDPDNKGEYTVMINPYVNIYSGLEQRKKESCLSYPGFSTSVPRYPEIMVTYWNEKMEKQVDKKYFHFKARVIQHELDHLSGKCVVGEKWKEEKYGVKVSDEEPQIEE